MAIFSIQTVLKKFGEQGEKTGWTYIELEEGTVQKIMPGAKKSFRVKGKIDNYPIEKIALMPMGDGHFIMPLKAEIRKAIGKQCGAKVTIRLEADSQDLIPPTALIDCLNDEPKALKQFNLLPKSHQHYFIRWIDQAKTDITKAKRISQTLNALITGQNFGEMLRNGKQNKNDNW
jgi:hypothetical protein